MREAGLNVPVIQVMLCTSPFLPNYYTDSMRFGLPFATNDTALFIRYAKAGIRQIFRQGTTTINAALTWWNSPQPAATSKTCWRKPSQAMAGYAGKR